MFGEVIRGEMFLNRIGRAVEEEWMRTDYLRREILLDEFIVMPNHVHDIIMITESDVVGATGGARLLLICKKPIVRDNINEQSFF